MRVDEAGVLDDAAEIERSVGRAEAGVELIQWEERLNDEALHTYAVVGTYVEIGRKLVERYRGLVSDVEFSIPAATERERGILRELIQEIRRETA